MSRERPAWGVPDAAATSPAITGGRRPPRRRWRIVVWSACHGLAMLRFRTIVAAVPLEALPVEGQ
jgi:hypothetical protein